MTLSGRIGCFFLFVGLIALLVFFAASYAGAEVFSYFMVGLAGLILGLVLVLRGRRLPPPGERFRIIRSSRDKFEETRRRRKRPGKE